MISLKEGFYQLVTNLRFNKKERQKRRKDRKEKLKNDQIKSAKFGVSYSVWDGEELLEKSIMQIREHVDYINVVWQEKSWTGLDSNLQLKEKLDKLVNIGLVDELIEYESLCNEIYQEPVKRNFGLQAARKAGCNYFMPMDTDEFYIAQEFEAAKNYMLEHDITNGFVLLKTYGSLPTRQWILVEQTPSWVPFFSKINDCSSIDCDASYPYLTDISRKVSVTKCPKFLLLPFIAMHHMSYLRKDLVKKMKNSSAAKAYGESNFDGNAILQGLDKNSVEVSDRFMLLPLIKKWNEKEDEFNLER